MGMEVQGCLCGDQDSGELDISDGFKERSTIYQLDVVGDWIDQLRIYFLQLLVRFFREQGERPELAAKTTEEQFAIFRAVAAGMGWEVPDGFEAFAMQHLSCALTVAELNGRPTCHRK